MITGPFLDALLPKMSTGGRLYISTDVESLWTDMKTKIQSRGVFELVKDDPFWETEYRTHWSIFSEHDQRQEWWATFEKKG